MNLQAISGQYTIASPFFSQIKTYLLKLTRLLSDRQQGCFVQSAPSGLCALFPCAWPSCCSTYHSFLLCWKSSVCIGWNSGQGTVSIGINYRNQVHKLACQKIKHRFQFCKAAISSTPIFLLQEICTNFLWINSRQSTFNSNRISQTF